MNNRVNVSRNLSDRYIESYNYTISKTCSEILVVIKAFNRYDGMLNQSYHIKGKSQSGRHFLQNYQKFTAFFTTDSNEFTDFVPPLNTTVLFDANETPY